MVLIEIGNISMTEQKNVFGEPLQACCMANMTGFLRNGYCVADMMDSGEHTICVQVSEPFLEFSQSVGNDLSTPRPEYDFPGLKPGDFWCVCIMRWIEAYQAGVAPLVRLESTNHTVLEYVNLRVLKLYELNAEQPL